MSARLRRLLLPILRDVKAGKPPTFRSRSAAAQALFLVEKRPSEKKRKATKQKKLQGAAARQAHNIATASLRMAALARSGLRCECGCGRTLLVNPEMDHFYGRARGQAIETVWMLHRDCHRDKTENRPSRAFWELKFSAHCVVHGYEFRPRLVKEIA